MKGGERRGGGLAVRDELRDRVGDGGEGSKLI